jgi:protein-S-isoprenylcysteine O-methyltransferase Ste14
MSLIPEFELGLWNGWLLILPAFFIFLLGTMINKEKFDMPSIPKNEERYYSMTIIIIFVCFIYPFFLPLELGTIWLYLGFIIYLPGMILLTLAEINFITTQQDTLVTKGVYRVSRNPMYLGALIVFVSIGIACMAWFYLMLAIIYFILSNIIILSEERFCLGKYGEKYEKYLNTTPRWIGVLKR